MIDSVRRQLVIVIAVVAAAASIAICAAAPAAAIGAQPNPADGFPEGPGKAPLLRVCSNCHGPEVVTQTLRTRQEWSDVIDQMARFGAEASDQDFEQILNYLVKFYSTIRVNRASAKELEMALDVPADVAAAIVSAREAKGAFKSVDDLKHVAGLDAAKLDALKPRLVFTE